MRNNNNNNILGYIIYEYMKRNKSIDKCELIMKKIFVTVAVIVVVIIVFDVVVVKIYK